MQLRLRFFAAAREAMGRSEMSLEVPEGATVGDLLAQLRATYPAFAALPREMMVSVNLDYRPPDHPLHDGDEVAFIPPVSGGRGDAQEAGMFEITREPLTADSVAEAVRADDCGGVVTFLGTVRSPSRGRIVRYLEYEAYPEMAVRKMQQIAAEIRERWGITRVAIRHRVGRLEVGEPSVAIAVAAPHRREAFEACEYAIARLKRIVPIWKKEVWADGEEWIGWEGTDEERPEGVPAATPA
ncbi:MAG TPA: molybdopterin converting factor subunit 1 [Chloroflexota bacterium]|nr:molybdopterin converting factor subunit 1 [Chloroflexota bacterium]